MPPPHSHQQQQQQQECVWWRLLEAALLSAAHPALQTLQSCRAAAGGWRGGGVVVGGPDASTTQAPWGGRGGYVCAVPRLHNCSGCVFQDWKSRFSSVNSTSIAQYLQKFAEFLLRVKICCW